LFKVLIIISEVATLLFSRLLLGLYDNNYTLNRFVKLSTLSYRRFHCI